MTGVLRASVDVRVPFHDVDPAGIVWHGRYFKYLDSARSSLLDRIGYGYREMAESGFVWPVVDIKARFLRPAEYDQILQVEATLAEWEYRLQIDYRISDAAGELITRATTVQVPVVVETKEMHVGVPRFVVALVEAALAGERGQ